MLPFIWSVVLWLYACKCFIFHIINYSQNVGTLWLEFLILYFFHGPCVKKSWISITRQTKIWTIFLSTHTPIKHHNKTPFMNNLNPNCDKNIYKSCQILKLKKWKWDKYLKIFPSKLYPLNIDVCFKDPNTSCTLLIFFLHYSSLENFDFLKQYDYIQLYIHL